MRSRMAWPRRRPETERTRPQTRSDGRPAFRTPRRATDGRSRATSQWVADHVQPERRHHPPGGSCLRRWLLRRVRKSTAQRYYQLLSGHAATGSFLHDRMTGPQWLGSDVCWWCNCGKRQTRHHLFPECRAWAPQIRRLWKRVGKDCHWEHLRAPSVRLRFI